ncbi:class I glutamine amidotransferase-like protein [Xylaria curta]|nr:class I glutamine amidotransferase-like protein [Xylaria curta]
MSLVKSLQHANMACYRRLDLVLIDASRLEYPNTEYEDLWLKVRTTQGILVPGGFGARGTEGMIDVIRYARENKVPFMGICLGMQLVVVEFARNVCSLSANSAEMDKQTPHPVVVDMPEIDFSKYGGTMRLGEKLTVFEPSSSSWSKVHAAYAGYSYQLHGDNNIESLAIQGRHRHHCGVNPLYIETLAEHGLVLVGKDEKGERMEILELRNHPWFVGVQFHPEYRSKVLIPAYQS